MTVQEMIDQLSKLPPSCAVEVWVGPSGYEDRENVTLIEGLEDGEGRKTCVLWTTPIDPED